MNQKEKCLNSIKEFIKIEQNKEQFTADSPIQSLNDTMANFLGMFKAISEFLELDTVPHTLPEDSTPADTPISPDSNVSYHQHCLTVDDITVEYRELFGNAYQFVDGELVNQTQSTFQITTQGVSTDIGSGFVKVPLYIVETNEEYKQKLKTNAYAIFYIRNDSPHWVVVFKSQVWSPGTQS
jgi:hypothetical protein